MVLRQGKRRVFLACRRHVHPVADTRRHAANHSTTHYGDYPCRLFRRRTDFQTTRLDVLVSRRRQRADACHFRRQPVCQTNRHRTPRPTATPRPSPRRRAPHPPRYANLVRLLHPQRRNRRHSGRLAILQLVGGLYWHRVVCVNGAFVCRRVGVSENCFEGVGRLKNLVALPSMILIFQVVHYIKNFNFKGLFENGHSRKYYFIQLSSSYWKEKFI